MCLTPTLVRRQWCMDLTSIDARSYLVAPGFVSQPTDGATATQQSQTRASPALPATSHRSRKTLALEAEPSPENAYDGLQPASTSASILHRGVEKTNPSGAVSASFIVTLALVFWPERSRSSARRFCSFRRCGNRVRADDLGFLPRVTSTEEGLLAEGLVNPVQQYRVFAQVLRGRRAPIPHHLWMRNTEKSADVVFPRAIAAQVSWWQSWAGSLLVIVQRLRFRVNRGSGPESFPEEARSRKSVQSFPHGPAVPALLPGKTCL